MDGAACRPKTKRGPAFPPALRCRRPLACPSGRRARRGAAGTVHYRQGTWSHAFQRSRCVRWPVTGTGRFQRAAIPPRCPCDPFPPCGVPASRSGHRSIRSPKGRFIRSPRVGSFARRLWFRRGCGCILADLPEGAAAPLQPAPPGPKTGFASMASGSVRCPKASAPALPPVTSDTRPRGAIGRLSVPFTHERCEHRPCGSPGWRPRPDPCGFPKAPAWLRP